MNPIHYAIVGAGLMGKLTAWRLLRQGHTITLFEQDPSHTKSAAFVAAAMLAPWSESNLAEQNIIDMGLQALPLWQTWLPELAQDSEQAIYHHQGGTIVVSHACDHALLQQFQRRVSKKLGTEHTTLLNTQMLNTLDSELTPTFQQGLYFPQESVICNRSLLNALQQVLNTRTSWCYETVNEPKDLMSRGFDHIIDARGLGAKPALPQLRGVRGEVIRVYAPDVHLKHCIRLIHPRYPLYISPRENHEYVIGATEIESEHDTPITVRSSLELLSALYSLHKGFGEAQVLETHAACRPALPDNQPLITHDTQLTTINGLYRHGFMLAPTLINQLLEGLPA